MGIRPLYIVRLANDGYYRGDSAWMPVSRANASRLVHKEARALCGRLKACGYRAEIEPAGNTLESTTSS